MNEQIKTNEDKTPDEHELVPYLEKRIKRRSIAISPENYKKLELMSIFYERTPEDLVNEFISSKYRLSFITDISSGNSNDDN
jgi:hypothetical protein